MIVFFTGINYLFSQAITPIPLPHDPSLNYYQKGDQIIQHFQDLDNANVPYEADEFLKYARWIDFWQDRVDNSPGVIGDTKHYTESIPLILNDASQNCNSGLNPVWEQLPIQTTLSQQGRIDALTFDANSNTLFAGNNRSGIWKISTATQGAQWVNVSDNINKPMVGCMDLELYYGDPQNPLSTPILFAGTGSVNNWDNNISYGVFRSNDFGNTWTNVLPFANDVNDAVIKIISYYEPNATFSPNHQVVFVATHKRVFRSLDGGSNWTLIYNEGSINDPHPGRSIGSMTLDFDDLQNDLAKIYFTVGANATNQCAIYRIDNASEENIVPGTSISLPFQNTYGDITQGCIPITNLPTFASIFLNIIPRELYLEHCKAPGGESYFYLWVAYSAGTNTINDKIDFEIFRTINDLNSWESFSYRDASGSTYPYNRKWPLGKIYPSLKDKDKLLFGTITNSQSYVYSLEFSGLASPLLTSLVPPNHPDHREILTVPNTNGSEDLFVGHDGGVSVFLNSSNIPGGFTLSDPNEIVNFGDYRNDYQIYGLGISDSQPNWISFGLQDNNSWLWDVISAVPAAQVSGGDGYDAVFYKDMFFNSSFGSRAELTSKYISGQTINLSVENRELSGCNNSFPSLYQGFLTNFTKEPQRWNHPFKTKVNPNNPDWVDIYYGFSHLSKKTIEYSTGSVVAGPFNLSTLIGSPVTSVPEQACGYQSKIADFAFGGENGEIIYMAYDGPDWNAIPSKQRFQKGIITNNGLGNEVAWSNIDFKIPNPLSGVFYPTQSYGITSIFVNPSDGNELWVSLSGFGNYPNVGYPIARVVHSTDGGLTWSDMSEGLPHLPADKIIGIETGCGNVDLYCGNDVSVYYFKNGIWECFKGNMPYGLVMDLEIDVKNNLLYASVHGRGIWRTPLVCEEPVAGLTKDINQSQTFSAIELSNCDIKVHPGATLTITGTLKMGANRKIMVEAGGKIVLDGGKITSLTNCSLNPHEMWQGIELWGDGTQIQTANLQGVIHVLNGGTIENAHEAISVYNTGIYGQHGGMVFCDGANFINNRRSVSFLSYNKWNVSYFKNCKFEVNDDYLPGDPFFAHVTMWDVKGIEFLGCKFFNYSTQAVNGDNTLRGRGLVSYDANFTVDEYCELPPNQQGGNCINIYPSRFSGFYTCIDALKLIDTKNYFVDQTNFSNCVYGIHSAAFDEVTIMRNNFEVGAAFFDTNEENCAGIVIETGTGYKIEENSFVKLGGMLEQRTVGVGLINTVVETEENIIYKNNFEDLFVANLSNGQNQGVGFQGAEQFGVKYECNSNNNLEPLGSWDFDVEPDWYNQSGNPPPGTGIATKQGSSGMAAANTFSHHPINGQTNYETDFKVYLPGISQTYEYYYLINNIPQEPISNSNSILAIMNFGIQENLCSSRIRETEGEGERLGQLSDAERAQNELSFLSAYQSKEQSELLLAQLTDGGNTPALKDEVETALSNQTWALRQDLLGKAPHLSKTVLTEAAENTVALPEAVLVEILEANPDVLRDQEFLDFLAQKNQPLPSYIIDSLRARSTLITARTLLLENIQLAQQKMQQIANEMLVYYINDTLDTTSIKLLEWLVNKNTLEADLAIAGLLFKQSRPQDALNLLNLLAQTRNLNPSTAALVNRTLTTFQISQSYQINHSLNATELEQLNNIAQAKGDYPSTLAKNLLSLHQQQSYLTHLVLPQNQSASRKAKVQKYVPLIVLPSLQVQPNPTDQWIAFTVGELQGLSVGCSIQISSSSGVIMNELKLNSGKGQYLLDTRGYADGVYFYRVIGSKEAITGKFVVQHEN